MIEQEIVAQKLEEIWDGIRKLTPKEMKILKDLAEKTSKYKGVHWDISGAKWMSKIKVNRRTIYLGSYNLEVEAALAYDVAARQYHKQFARLNFDEEKNYVY